MSKEKTAIKIKNMKKIIVIIVILVGLTLNAQGSLSPLTQFVGTWENDNGNETFQVELFISINSFSQESYIRGHYRLIDNATGNYIYRSDKTIVNSLGETITILPQIGAFYLSHNNSISGTIRDNTTFDYVNINQGGILSCNVYMVLQNDCTGCTPELIWEVRRGMGTFTGPIYQPLIPTSLILTKVN